MRTHPGTGEPVYTVVDLTRLLNLSASRVLRISDEGKLPAGCEPARDIASGARYWTADQYATLTEWAAVRRSTRGTEAYPC